MSNPNTPNTPNTPGNPTKPSRPIWKTYRVKLILTYRDDHGYADDPLGEERGVCREVEVRAVSPRQAQDKALLPYDLSGQVEADGAKHELVWAEAYATYLGD